MVILVRPHSYSPQISTKWGQPSWQSPCHPRIASWKHSSCIVSVRVRKTREVVSSVFWIDNVIRVFLSSDHLCVSSHSPLMTPGCPMGDKGAQAFAQALESRDSAIQRLVLESACVIDLSILFSPSHFSILRHRLT